MQNSLSKRGQSCLRYILKSTNCYTVVVYGPADDLHGPENFMQLAGGRSVFRGPVLYSPQASIPSLKERRKFHYTHFVLPLGCHEWSPGAHLRLLCAIAMGHAQCCTGGRTMAALGMELSLAPSSLSTRLDRPQVPLFKSSM